MRTLSVIAALACVLALSGVAAGAVVGDADDAALMEIGVDLSSALHPTPTYVTTPPPGHDMPTMAKFPLMHEIAGVEAKDWQDIQGLLFREPVVASESSLDMKLDELEAKFNKIDTMPVPSPIAPPGSTLLPKKVEIELGLRATLDKPRMVQKPTAKAAAAAPKAKAAAAAPKAVAAKSIAAAPVAKAAAAKPKAAAAKPAAAAAKPAAAPAKPTPATVNEAVSTVKLIEKRIRGLSILFQRLKANIGIAAAGSKAAVAAPARVGSAAPAAKAKAKADPSAAKRVQAALNKHRKDAADLKKRMAAKKKSRFVQLGMDLDADLDAETEAEAQESFEAEQQLMAEGDSFAELDAEAEVDAEAETEVEAETEAESEAQVESEAEAEAELNLDAEAVDQILETLM